MRFLLLFTVVPIVYDFKHIASLDKRRSNTRLSLVNRDSLQSTVFLSTNSLAGRMVFICLQGTQEDRGMNRSSCPSDILVLVFFLFSWPENSEVFPREAQ